MATQHDILQAFEAFDSQTVKVTAAQGGDSMTLRAYVLGTEDRDEALLELRQHLTNVLTINGYWLVVIDEIDIKPYGYKSWVADISYISPRDANAAETPKRLGEVTFEFDGTGGQSKVFYAFEQRKYGDDAPDYGKAIGVDENGKPLGVDIVVPQCSFSLHQSFEGATITLPWLRQVIYLTGCVNRDAFLGFAPGEVLFLGPSGQQPLAFLSDGTVEKGERDVTFRFALSPNIPNMTIGDIEGIEKTGHQYLWTLTRPDEDLTIEKPKTVGVYVSTVYRPESFAVLGINDPDTNHPVAG
jgi:hypothetical protein